MEISPEHPSSAAVTGSAKVGRDQLSESSTKRATTIQWDEETIAEHDKERGTRQKVVERLMIFISSQQSSHITSHHITSSHLTSPHLTMQYITLYQID